MGFGWVAPTVRDAKAAQGFDVTRGPKLTWPLAVFDVIAPLACWCRGEQTRC
jgi:hypothetical protein